MQSLWKESGFVGFALYALSTSTAFQRGKSVPNKVFALSKAVFEHKVTQDAHFSNGADFISSILISLASFLVSTFAGDVTFCVFPISSVLASAGFDVCSQLTSFSNAFNSASLFSLIHSTFSTKAFISFHKIASHQSQSKNLLVKFHFATSSTNLLISFTKKLLKNQMLFSDSLFTFSATFLTTSAFNQVSSIFVSFISAFSFAISPIFFYKI
jgi:hypothetical protein